MAKEESTGIMREGSIELILGPLLLEPRKMYFTISYVYPDVPVNIDISRLHEQTVLLRFQNTHTQDLKDISCLKGVYTFS
ncbi:MAG: hypothetical protein ACUVUS_07395 [Thermoproteota archaeon]